MKDRNSKINLKEKIEKNIWDSVEDVIDVINLARKGKWIWWKNCDCKYINVRIDMRDGGCIIKNGKNERIDPKDLLFQYQSEKIENIEKE